MKTRIEKRRPIIYIEIKEILKKEILSGRLNLLSESKIIHQFKVSSTTARRVLNDLEEEGLIERKVGKGSIIVLPSEKEIKELWVIFFDIYDPNQPFISEIVKGIEENSRIKRYYLHLYTTRESSISSNHNSSLYHIITKRKIDGLFILSPISEKDINFLKKERMPFVVIGNIYSNTKAITITFDYEKAIKDICGALWEYGYKKIAIVTGPKEERGIKRAGYFCLLSYKKFLKEKGIFYNDKLVKEIEDKKEDGYRIMEEFYLLNKEERSEAIIITNFKASEGALRFTKDDWKVFIVPFTDEDIKYPFYVKCPYREICKVAV
jgi:LacI family transcriptional regulator